MIEIVHPACNGLTAKFMHADAALAFLRALAGQLAQADFVAVVVATSGEAYRDLAVKVIAGCMGTPM